MDHGDPQSTGETTHNRTHVLIKYIYNAE